MPIGVLEDRLLGSIDLEESIRKGKASFQPGKQEKGEMIEEEEGEEDPLHPPQHTHTHSLSHPTPPPHTLTHTHTFTPSNTPSPGLLADAHRGVLYMDDINLMDTQVLSIVFNCLSQGYVQVGFFSWQALASHIHIH